MSVICRKCNLPLFEAKEDCVQLNGSCSHLVHLGCWKTYGCCDRPEGSVDLEEILLDPHRILEPSTPDLPEVTNVFHPFARLFAGFSRTLDAAVDKNATTLARKKTPVQEMLKEGYTAPNLVKEEREIVPILILDGEYTAVQLSKLGFTWDLLIQGGLSERNFKDIYKVLGTSLIETFLKDIQSLLELCSQDIKLVPRLGISADDLGLKITAKDLSRVGMDDRTLIEFGFSVEEWATKLGLGVDQLPSDQTMLRKFVNDDPVQKEAFDHFYPSIKFSLDELTDQPRPKLPERRPEARGRFRQPRRGIALSKLRR